ncbi:MAG TPA: hypothetical protein VJK02_10980, partial [Anaerolineales bacterium]|nr:hypothetical protein [Anaerolineales bacterium]
TPNKPSPQPVGTTIVFTAAATGGTAPQFQFWVRRVVEPSTFTSPFTLLCDYSSNTTCPWTHNLAGDYSILVWARSGGASGPFEADQEISFRLEHL